MSENFRTYGNPILGGSFPCCCSLSENQFRGHKRLNCVFFSIYAHAAAVGVPQFQKNCRFKILGRFEKK